ncbi:hypothetical protein BH10PSE14_BH10PSE14_27610 [soil metagenome]
MDEPDLAPLMQANRAPDLPHFGKLFGYHGPSGILTFRIDTQEHTHDGLVMLTGICVDGAETYPETGRTKDCRGQLLSVFVTESEYMRLTNARLA